MIIKQQSILFSNLMKYDVVLGRRRDIIGRRLVVPKHIGNRVLTPVAQVYFDN